MAFILFLSSHRLVQGKEETFQFLEAVLKEVMDLFPSDYIHIGGDEVKLVPISRPCNLPDIKYAFTLPHSL